MARQASTKPLLSFKADPTKELKGVSVRQSLQDKLDAYALLKTMVDNWQTAFRDGLKPIDLGSCAPTARAAAS